MLFIKKIMVNLEMCGFEISINSMNEARNYYKYSCRLKMKSDYLVIIINNNKIVGDNNFLSIRFNNKFIMRNRSFSTLDDIKSLLILCISKLKELGLIDDSYYEDTIYGTIEQMYVNDRVMNNQVNYLN